VIRELDKPRLVPNLPPMEAGPPPFHAPPAHPVAAAPAQPVAAPPPAAAATEADEGHDEADDVPPAPSSDGRRLSDVAREAALSADRTVIADTLRQVHWNRRKAAQLLGVSYKTLLNKIKETGIERP
jgi:DNA-binding NtrC family response regulator